MYCRYPKFYTLSLIWEILELFEHVYVVILRYLTFYSVGSLLKFSCWCINQLLFLLNRSFIFFWHPDATKSNSPREVTFFKRVQQRRHMIGWDCMYRECYRISVEAFLFQVFILVFVPSGNSRFRLWSSFAPWDRDWHTRTQRGNQYLMAEWMLCVTE